MAEKAVDAIHGEMLAPVVAPLRLIVALHREQKLADGLRKLAQPGVVFVGVLRRRRHQLDHRAEGALRAQDRPARFAHPASAVDRSPKNRARKSPPPGPCRGDNRSRTPDPSAARWRWISKSRICRRPTRCTACGTACRAAARPPVARPCRRFASPGGFGSRWAENRWRPCADVRCCSRSPCRHAMVPSRTLKTESSGT